LAAADEPEVKVFLTSGRRLGTREMRETRETRETWETDGLKGEGRQKTKVRRGLESWWSREANGVVKGGRRPYGGCEGLPRAGER